MVLRSLLSMRPFLRRPHLKQKHVQGLFTYTIPKIYIPEWYFLLKYWNIFPFLLFCFLFSWIESFQNNSKQKMENLWRIFVNKTLRDKNSCEIKPWKSKFWNLREHFKSLYSYLNIPLRGGGAGQDLTTHDWMTDPRQLRNAFFLFKKGASLFLVG